MLQQFKAQCAESADKILIEEEREFLCIHSSDGDAEIAILLTMEDETRLLQYLAGRFWTSVRREKS